MTSSLPLFVSLVVIWRSAVSFSPSFRLRQSFPESFRSSLSTFRGKIGQSRSSNPSMALGYKGNEFVDFVIAQCGAKVRVHDGEKNGEQFGRQKGYKNDLVKTLGERIEWSQTHESS